MSSTRCALAPPPPPASPASPPPRAPTRSAPRPAHARPAPRAPRGRAHRVRANGSALHADQHVTRCTVQLRRAPVLATHRGAALRQVHHARVVPAVRVVRVLQTYVTEVGQALRTKVRCQERAAPAPARRPQSHLTRRVAARIATRRRHGRRVERGWRRSGGVTQGPAHGPPAPR